MNKEILKIFEKFNSYLETKDNIYLLDKDQVILGNIKSILGKIKDENENVRNNKANQRV